MKKRQRRRIGGILFALALGRKPATRGRFGRTLARSRTIGRFLLVGRLVRALANTTKPKPIIVRTTHAVVEVDSL